MALEAVVFPQDRFGYGSTKDLYNLMGSSGGSCSYEFPKEDNEDDFYFLSNQTENSPNYHYNAGDDDHYYYSNNNNNNFSCMDPNFKEFQPAADPSSCGGGGGGSAGGGDYGGGGGGGSCRPARRRRRTKSEKNKEEIENQRITHIAVERNRRKQMNEYLSVLRSLMPDSYVQRGDQASIIGGAINFVKQLEQQVHLLSAQTDVKPFPNPHGGPNPIFLPLPPLPFSHFFTFPQFSSTSPSPSPSSSSSTPSLDSSSAAAMASNDNNHHNPASSAAVAPTNQIQSSIADIEVSMADSHAHLKIRCKKLPKQLLKIVSGLHTLHLTVLHLNVSTVHQFVLYSFSLKVEEDCGLSSVDEIARAVYQLLCRIQEEAFSI